MNFTCVSKQNVNANKTVNVGLHQSCVCVTVYQSFDMDGCFLNFQTSFSHFAVGNAPVAFNTTYLLLTTNQKPISSDAAMLIRLPNERITCTHTRTQREQEIHERTCMQCCHQKCNNCFLFRAIMSRFHIQYAATERIKQSC